MAFVLVVVQPKLDYAKWELRIQSFSQRSATTDNSRTPRNLRDISQKPPGNSVMGLVGRTHSASARRSSGILWAHSTFQDFALRCWSANLPIDALVHEFV